MCGIHGGEDTATAKRPPHDGYAIWINAFLCGDPLHGIQYVCAHLRLPDMSAVPLHTFSDVVHKDHKETSGLQLDSALVVDIDPIVRDKA